MTIHARGRLEAAAASAIVAGVAAVTLLVASAPASAGDSPSASLPSLPTHVRVSLGSPVIGLLQSTSVSVSGITAERVEVRLLGAIDRSGLAYEWTPYRWRPLWLLHGTWYGVLPAPPLHGIYRLQLRLDHGRSRLSSERWLLRVFPRGTLTRGSFRTAPAAVRDLVDHLPGDEALRALRRWPEATFDHRDPRMHRLFVIAYAPRGDSRASARLGLFITTVRNGYHGRWRVLRATVAPYD